jgi:hypothetical protein
LSIATVIDVHVLKTVAMQRAMVRMHYGAWKLGQRAGIPHDQCRAILMGHVVPSEAELQAIARALGVSVSEITNPPNRESRNDAKTAPP